MESCVFRFYLTNMTSIWICRFQRATQESYKGKGYNWPKKKKKGCCNVNYIKHLHIYIRTNTVTHMFTHIRNRICFSFHLKFPFFYIDESNMLRTFPLYQLYLQILRHHRHKIPQTQLQQVSDVKGWSLSIVLQWD